MNDKDALAAVKEMEDDYLDKLFAKVPPLLDPDPEKEMTVERAMKKYGKGESLTRDILNHAVLDGRYSMEKRRQIDRGGYCNVYLPVIE